MQQGYNYIVNITSVIIQTYSDISSSPGSATLYAVQSTVNMFSTQTSFNLVTNNTLLFNSKISSSSLTSGEISQLSTADTILYACRSSLTLLNFILQGDLSNYQSSSYFLRPVYIQNKSINLTNIEIHLTGYFMKSVDPLSLFITNLYMDFYAMMGGFDLNIECNYPEAYLTGNIITNNMTVLNSRTRIAAFRLPFIVSSGPENIHLTNTNVFVGGSLLEDRASIETVIKSGCLPNDGVIQNLIYDQTTMSMPDNPDGIHFITFYGDLAADASRNINLKYINSVFYDQNYMVYPTIQVFSNLLVSFYVLNCKFSNVICIDGCIMVTLATIADIENNIYLNTTGFNYATYNLLEVNTITMKNVTHQNVNGTGTSQEYFIMMSLNDNGVVQLESVNFYNCDLGVQPGMHFDGSVKSLVLKNSIFSSVKVGSRNYLFDASLLGTIEITNCTFSSISSSTSTDNNNLIFNIRSINLANALNSTINNISVQSSISFLEFNSLTGSLTSPLTFAISNIAFSNCSIANSISIISFGNLETSEDITYTFQNITFNNIWFSNKGDLMKFQHQFVKNQIYVSSSTFTNIFGGDIYVEAGNKNNLSIPTKVSLQNCIFSNINTAYNSLILVYEGGDVEIDSSTFNNISSYQSGSVVFAGYQLAIVTIISSNFTNNYAIAGGIFNTESQSLISISNCILSYNFAITSGVIQATNNGYYYIYNSTISHNYGISNSISEITDSAASTSIINNSKIFSNSALTISSFLSEINTKCVNLCFLSTSFVSLINRNPKLYSVTESNYAFSIILGILTVQNSSNIYDQNSIFDSFESTLTISNTNIFNISNADTCISISSSIIYLKNVEIYGISSSNTQPIIRVVTDTTLNIDGFKYYNSQANFISIYSATVVMNNLIYENSTSSDNSPPLLFDKCDNLVFSNWTVLNVSSLNSNYIFQVSNSNLSATNISLSNLQQNAWSLLNDNISMITQIKIYNCSKGLEVDNSVLTLLTNSSFVYSGSSAALSGGALVLFNSNATVSNCIFNSNTAIEGGAIYYDCSTSNYCDVTISNSSFSNNTAIKQGGAINYTLYRPKITNSTYSNNTAVYGGNIASYAMQIYVLDQINKSISFSNAGSGIAYDTSFTLGLYDYERQIVVADSISQITITKSSSQQNVAGTNLLKVNKGVATFSNIIFISNPGDTDINFAISTSGLNPSNLKIVYGSDYQISSIVVNFRFCKPGEQITTSSGNKICATCSPGTYSLNWNSTECLNCISDTVCDGGDAINVNSGFWRRTLNSTFIAECQNSNACLGGFNRNSDYPIYCADGYDGYLCSNCISNSTVNYERTEAFACSKCPDPILNALKVIGLFLAVVVYLTILITFNIKKKGTSQRSVLIRILTNHIQLLTLSYAYTTKFPKIVSQIFSPITSLNTSSESAVSFDCFANAATLKMFAPSIAIFKMLICGISPIVMFIFAALIFLICHLFFPKWFTDFKRNLMISLITIVYLLLPTITTLAFGIFQCITVDDGVSRVKLDLEIECYSYVHLFWCGVLGIPMIVIWVFGFPIVGLYALIKKRHKLDDPEVKRYYIVLYQGYKPSCFYWEFVNVFRKVALLSVNVFLSRFSYVYKSAAASIVIVSIIRVQIKLAPYVFQWNNELELLSNIAAGLTIMGGLIFSTGNSVALFDLMIFILIVIFNGKFFIFWVYLMAKATEDQFPIIRKLSIILGIILNRKESQDKLIEDPFSSAPKTTTFKSPSKYSKILKKKKKKAMRKGKLKNPQETNDLVSRSINAQNGSSRPLTEKEKLDVVIYMGESKNTTRNKEENKFSENSDDESYLHKKKVVGKKFKPKINRKYSDSSHQKSKDFANTFKIKKPAEVKADPVIDKIKVIDMFELFNSISRHSKDPMSIQRSKDEFEKHTSDRMWNQYNRNADERIKKALLNAKDITDSKEEVKIEDPHEMELYKIKVDDRLSF